MPVKTEPNMVGLHIKLLDLNMCESQCDSNVIQILLTTLFVT